MNKHEIAFRTQQDLQRLLGDGYEVPPPDKFFLTKSGYEARWEPNRDYGIHLTERGLWVQDSWLTKGGFALYWDETFSDSEIERVRYYATLMGWKKESDGE